MLDEFGSVILGRPPLESGVLSRKNELKDLRERLAQLEKEIQETENGLSLEKGQLENLESRLESTELKTRELTQSAADLTARLDRERINLDTARQEQLAGQQEERRLISESERLTKELNDQKTLLEAAEKATVGFQNVLENINLQIEEIAQQETVTRVEADNLRAKASQINLKLQLLKRQKGEKSQQVESIQEDMAREERDLNERIHQLKNIEQTLLSTGMEQARLQMERDLTREARRHAESLLSQKRQELEQLARETSNQLNEINQRRAHFSNLEKERQRLMVRLEQIQERLREEEITEINQICPEDSWNETEFDRAKDLEALKEMQTRMQRLGLVNHEAARELTLIEERRQGLSDQLEDLHAARKNLLESLNTLNETATAKFTECFAAIQDHFRDLFRKIFGGGTAELSLEDPTTPLDTGIEVMARPPGKDAARLSLMSGGERTMTAVALLLAVFKSRPGPFCLMDEVDAALDEANVDRFASVLKEFSEKTQFILISHHKRTMASATVLHGITMKEPGVSIRYSVNIEDYMNQSGNGGNGTHLAA
jgi:chromosome segregation protein